MIEKSDNKLTVGKASLDLLKKGDEKQSVLETTKEMLKGYIDNLIESAISGEEKYGREQPFYVCVQTRREKLLTNVIRNQFYTRQTRPVPQYDLALYWYNPLEERLEFVWCIPDKKTVEQILDSHEMGTLHPEQYQLYEFCRGFILGTLI